MRDRSARYAARERVRELVDNGCPITLNGKPATISGFTLEFATISDRQTHLSAEWAWESVEGVVKNHGGKFNSP